VRFLAGARTQAGGEIPWEPRKSTVGAEETLSEFAGTWPEYPDASTRSAEPEHKGDDTGERGDDKAEGQPLAPRGRAVRASVKLYPITISDRAAGQPRLWTLPSDERTGRFDQQRMRGLELLPGRLDLLRRLDLTLSCLEQ
jgi:hypothetical protein